MISGSLLKYYREKNNLTIEELARELVVPKKIVEAWENDKKKPREGDIQKLCDIYNINREDLILKDNKWLPRIISFILAIGIGFSLDLVIKNYEISLSLAITFFILVNSVIFLRREAKNNLSANEVKSILGVGLLNRGKKKRVFIYIVEAVMLGSIYVIGNIVLKLVGLDEFLIEFDLSFLSCFYDLINWLIQFVVLVVVLFLIEYVFSEMLLKNIKERESDE